MHIKRFRCAHLPPLGSVELGCNERVNLLIGPNSCGKSTILRAINELYSSKESYTPSPPLAPSAHMEASDEWPRSDDPDPYSAMWGLVPLLYIRLPVSMFRAATSSIDIDDVIQHQTFRTRRIWKTSSRPILESSAAHMWSPPYLRRLRRNNLK